MLLVARLDAKLVGLDPSELAEPTPPCFRVGEHRGGREGLGGVLGVDGHPFEEPRVGVIFGGDLEGDEQAALGERRA